MIRFFGDILLFLALISSFIQCVFPLVGHWRNNIYLLALARPAASGQFIFIVSAYILLTIAFVTNDFSIAYVGANSHPALPFLYRLTALWGAHEGSILLWIVMLNGWTMVFTFIKTQFSSRTNALVLAHLGLISFCFLSFLIFTSNPFLPSSMPQAAGNDLNPLLQDPGFVIHPPMLYAGYVGFSVAFAITQASLLRSELDQRWSKITLQFAIAAWCFLTLGITLGSWWAYRVLGWGGFWFWDPVENASLLPWLSGTALIHVLLLTEKYPMAKAWASLLAIICFSLSLLGTFLVRSGLLISAHTFANDPARGVFLLLLLGFLLTLSLVIYVSRIPRAHSSTRPIWLSREMILLLNSLLLFVSMLTILLGTLYPLILDALHLKTISVGAPYFNTVMLPLVFLIMFFMGLAPLCQWQTETTKHFWHQAIKNMGLSLVSALFMLWFFTQHFNCLIIVGLTLSIWIILSLIRSFSFANGMFFAHLGCAVLMIGILFASLLNVEREVRIQPGDSVAVGPYQFLFLGLNGTQGSNYRGVRASFEVVKNNRHIINLYPEKRIYWVRDMVMTKVDIHPGIFRDLYIALGEPLDNTSWSARIYYKPFVRWIWMGGMMMIVGGIISLLQRRSRTLSCH